MILKCFYDNIIKGVLILAPGREFLCYMCPISCNIYGIKLNKVRFSWETVIIHYLDKPNQEINFKSVLLFKF